MTPVSIVLNAGSSSLKFQVFETHDGREPSVDFRGLFEGLGGSAHFVVKGTDGTIIDETTWSSGDRFGHEEALMHLISWLREHQEDRSPLKNLCPLRHCISPITLSRSGSCCGACRGCLR